MKLLGFYPISIILVVITVVELKTIITPNSFISIAVNTTLSISCSLNDSNATISDLHLKECVPQSCETLTPYRQTNTTKFYQHTFTNVTRALFLFDCRAGNDSSHLEVVVGYKPELPDNVDCISTNHADLECTWDIPETTSHNSLESAWNITYSDGSMGYRECPEKKINENTITCHIPAQADHLSLYDMFLPSVNYTLNLTLKNSIGVASRLYYIPIDQRVKLTPPPMDIKPQRKEILVSLSMPPEYKDNRDLGAVVEYVLSYKPTWSMEIKQVTLSSSNDTVLITLPNCVPYTTYMLTMKAKPIKSQYWSDLTQKSVHTKPDVPYHRPVISEGLYTVNNITSKVKGFTLFYKPLVKRYWNSHNCLINVKISDQRNDTVWDGNFTLTNAYLEIPFEITRPRYNVTLRYVNSEGPSDIASSVEIANKENKMIVMAEETKNGFVISWEPDANNYTSSAVTVMWCTRKSAGVCKNDIEWKVFKNPGNSLFLTEVEHDKNKIFGVSVQYNNGTSTGMAYPKCYYILQNAVDQPKLFFKDKRSNTGQLFVDIITPYCEFPSKPVLYEVFYQEHTGQKRSCPNDFSKNLTVDASYELQSISLTNVNSKISYDVCMGVTMANKRVMYSAVQTAKQSGTTLNSDDEDYGAVAGILSAIIVLIVILLLLWWLKQKYFSMDTSISMPAIESFENPGYKHDLSEEKDIREIVVDSGTQSMPESLSSEDQADGDRDSVSSSGIGSTKCESDVFSPPTTPTDATNKITLVFQTNMSKSPRSRGADHMAYRVNATSDNENQNQDNTTSGSGNQHMSSSCSNPIDSYAKGDWEENELNEMPEGWESSGDFSGDYQRVMCSNYSSTCASDSENIDTCPSTPELTRKASQSTICDSDTMDDAMQTFSSGNISSQCTFDYNTNIQIDSSGDHVTQDPPYSAA